MKRNTSPQNIIRMLSLRSGEEKLRVAFGLSELTRKLRKEGEKYAARLKEKEAKRYIDKLAWIFIKDGKILVTLSRGKDKWYIPGGKRGKGESDEQALTREIKEELSVDLDQTKITFYGVFEAQAHGKPEGTIVRMTCYLAEFNGRLNPSGEIEKMAFFTQAQKELTSLVDHLLFDDLKNKGVIK